MATVPETGDTIVPGATGGEGARLSMTGVLTGAYVLMCALSLLPFLLVENPPIVDFANHAARLSLACGIGDPAVDAMYSYRFGLIPNLAVDLVNWPLCGTVSPAVVLQAVTAGSMVLIYASAWLIQRKLFGGPNAFLLLLPAFAVNLVTTMGYINFLAGAGIACLMVAVAIGRERNFPALMAIGNLGGLILFFCHIFALALAIVLFFGIMLRGAPRSAGGLVRAGLKTAALFALPLVLVPFVPSGHEALTLDYLGKSRALAALFLAPHANPTIYGILAFVPLYLAFRKGWVRVHPGLMLPLCALALYVAVVPSGIRTAVDVDGRTLVVLGYLFFASLEPVRFKREVTMAVAAISAASVAYALLMTVLVWGPFSREIAELRRSVQVLPAKALVLSVREDGSSPSAAQPISYGHLSSYATLERRVFNPFDFTGIGMQPLTPRPAFAPFDTPDAMPYNAAITRKLADPDALFEEKIREYRLQFAERWPERFDFVIYYHFGKPPNFDPARLTIVEQGSFYSILKVRRQRTAP